MTKLVKKKKETNEQLINKKNINISEFSVEQELELVTQYLRRVQHKIDFADAVHESHDWLSMKQVADLLAYEGYGQTNLFKFLRNRGVLINRKGIKNVHNTPYREYIERKYFKTIEQNYGVNKDRISIKTIVSQKGLEFIRRLLNDDIDE